MDGSGQIRYTEFLAATIETFGSIGEERLAEAFDRLDSDDSGYITTENLAELLGTEFPKKEIDEIVREADIYRDGRISYPEFLALWEDYHEQDRFDLLSEITMESSDDSDKRNVLAARAGFVERRIASERGLPPQNVTITSFVS